MPRTVKNNQTYCSQIKEYFIFAALILLAIFLPEGSIDPWGLFRIKKLVELFVGLLAIQRIAQELTIRFGSKRGALTSGLLAGFISSTALTVSLAHRSKAEAGSSELGLQMSAGILAMNLQGLLLVYLGIQDWHFKIFFIFAPMILISIFWINKFWQPLQTSNEPPSAANFDLASSAKLAGFIFLILTFTKILQNWLGAVGIFVLTFLFSLFEMHGSIIANVQMHETSSLDLPTLASLLSVSLVASLLTKVVLVQTLGSQYFQRQVWFICSTLACAVLIGWLLFAWSP